ncbi:ThiF family adenylyltransferase [Sodalis-like secondary symbiont of Drepanosiphum platanoidis]|uniref:HesA/MoeB/ThiF family protein n=1 Tax=Sodalis-like secondary symbiont of Drepanosiphum platanoidis TaxID=2994493 RepID=UPI003464C22E
MLNNKNFLRYHRQIFLKDIGEIGQEKLFNSSVLIVGLGGLGSPTALYLSASGIGKIFLADYDLVDESNLQRQILYNINDINKYKAKIAKKKLLKLNPLTKYISINSKLNDYLIDKYVSLVDLVLDCSDNMDTRFSINKYCVKYKKILISGSAIRFSGQFLVFSPNFKYGCYACLFPNKLNYEYNCKNYGILGPIVGIIGSMQSLEAIKILSTNLPINSIGKLYIFNGKTLKWSIFNLTKNKNCKICL